MSWSAIMSGEVRLSCEFLSGIMYIPPLAFQLDQISVARIDESSVWADVPRESVKRTQKSRYCRREVSVRR